MDTSSDPFTAARAWTRPELVSVGRLPARRMLRRDGDVVSLDGTWDLALLDRPGGKVRHEGPVEVPGCWTMQDVGDPPRYTNVQMPFPGEAAGVPDDNPTGIHRRRVEVPASWGGDRIILHVGGAETVLHVTVDGRPIGMGTDSRLPHDFDLTDHVTAGEPFDLELTVVRWGAATHLEDQDHWHHAGLHRSVLVYRTPQVHIADLVVHADRDPSSGVGSLRVRAEVGGSAVDGARIRVLLDGRQLGDAPVTWEPADVMELAYLHEATGARLETDVGEVDAWSAETPNLHEVAVELVDADGETVLDRLELRTGFRRVEVVGHELLVNGRPVLIKGVNRHDHDPRRGKAVTRESIRRDIELMKAHNLNAVRTAHYPSDTYLYEVCDELGMYVVDEANLETHARLRSLTSDPVWASAILERVMRMARRDVSHPSIIIWSLANESGASPVLDAAATWLRSFDPSRPVQYESGHFAEALDRGLLAHDAWHRRRIDTDIVAPMYPRIDDLVAWATSAPPQQPLIMCEYEHAMNNSCGELDRYWETIRTYPGLQGGFIWDWADQALYRSEPDGSERLVYGGDIGGEPHDGPFCLNGLVDAERNPHPSLLETAAVLAPIRFTHLGGGRVEVRSELDFVDASTLGPLRWEVTVDGDPVAGGSGELDPVGLAPGATTTIDVPIPAVRPEGWQVAHLTLRLGPSITWQAELARSSQRTAEGADPVIDVDHGGSSDEVRLALWRAPIDNEVFGPPHAARWTEQDLPNAHDRIDLRTEVSGTHVTHEVTIPAELDDIPRVGVRIRIPAEAVEVEWVGRGPHENHTDRRASAIVGRWRTRIDDWPVPYVHPQASGNRSDVRELRFLDTRGEQVCAFSELDDLQATVSRWTDEEVAAAHHLEDLPVRDHAWLWIDVAHRGVGSGAVGPDVDPRHRIAPGTYRWSYRRT